MATRNELSGDYNCTGSWNFSGTHLIPAGTIRNAEVSASAAIAATKLEHQFPIAIELFGPAVSVAALTKLAYAVRGATGTIVGFEAFISVVADDASRTIDVDLQKSTGGAAFATVCSASADFTNASTVRVPVAATLSSTSLVDGDLLQIVVTVAGGSGNQATGLHATIMLREAAA
jgi:hypothetical protein